MAKQAGFSDGQIADKLGMTESEVRILREDKEIKPWSKQVV